MQSIPLLVMSLACTAYGQWGFLSNCCEARDEEHLGRICDDGSQAPPHSCCGVGWCNVFCCNCDGGCKTGEDKPYMFFSVWGADNSSNFRPTIGASEVAADAILGRQMDSYGDWHDVVRALVQTELAYQNQECYSPKPKHTADWWWFWW